MACHVDVEQLTAAKADFALNFFSQLLNPKFDITGSGEVRAGANGI